MYTNLLSVQRERFFRITSARWNGSLRGHDFVSQAFVDKSIKIEATSSNILIHRIKLPPLVTVEFSSSVSPREANDKLIRNFGQQSSKSHKKFEQKNFNIIKFRGPLGSIEINVQKMDKYGLTFFKLSSEALSDQDLKFSLEENYLEIFIKKYAMNKSLISCSRLTDSHPFDSQKLNQNLPFAADQGAHKNTSISDSLLGTFRSIFQNAIEGVSIGFVLYLELVGVGYKAIIHSAKSSEDSLRQPSQFAGMVQPSQLAGMVQPSQFAGMVHEERAKNQIEFKLGQSHDIYFQLPSSIKAFAIKPTLIGLYSIDKAELNQIAAEIRSIRPPEPYKGKGIRFKDEVIKNKVGKKK